MPMNVLPLQHSWPLWEQGRQFELGFILNSAITDAIPPVEIGGLGIHHAGLWECDLADDKLAWSGGVYDIFGLPRYTTVTRETAVSFYSEQSRAAMERLRAHAIKHRRGFTIDIEIRAAIGETRSVRLVAAPVCRAGKVTRLHGLKLII